MKVKRQANLINRLHWMGKKKANLTGFETMANGSTKIDSLYFSLRLTHFPFLTPLYLYLLNIFNYNDSKTQSRTVQPSRALSAQAGLRKLNCYFRTVAKPTSLRFRQVRRGQEINKSCGGM